VPEDIPHGCPKSLGHGDEFHAALHEIKQGQIFFKNKQANLVCVSSVEEPSQQTKHILSDTRPAALNY
jgi:hypothetical protein